MIKQAFEIAIKDYAYIPLHQQALAWGVSKKVKLTQRRGQPGPAVLGDQTGIGGFDIQGPGGSALPGPFRFRVRNRTRAHDRTNKK